MADAEYHKSLLAYWLDDDEIAETERNYFEGAAETEAEIARLDAEREEWGQAIAQINAEYESHTCRTRNGERVYLDIRKAKAVTLGYYSV